MIKVKKLMADAILPTRATEGSAGYDLYSVDDILIVPGMSEVIPTGIAMEIPRGYVGLLSHRSSMAFKLDSIASLGYLDSDYRGEIKVKIFNLGSEGVRIAKGDRFAQVALVPCLQEDTVEGELSVTTRGAGGFGSSGS